MSASVAAASSARRVPPPPGTCHQSPLHAASAPHTADHFARFRWSRHRRVVEVCALRDQLLALAHLPYGKVRGQDTATRIAGDVRQMDIMHAPAVARHDPLLLGGVAALAHDIAAAYGITRVTHRIASIKLLVTPACTPGRPPSGEQMVHWDFSDAYLSQGKFTMLWHLTAAPGQRTTALPRFAAYHQPDVRTTKEELRAFLPALFDKANYESDAAVVGDVTLFDMCAPHFGTSNESCEERAVVFFMFVARGTHNDSGASQRCAHQVMARGLASDGASLILPTRLLVLALCCICRAQTYLLRRSITRTSISRTSGYRPRRRTAT
jgi:hypothetical protein